MYNYEKVKDVLNDRVLVIAVEELCELSQQLTKTLRGKMNKESLLEEYADALIVMEWIKKYCNLTDEEIKFWLYKKNSRNKKKIEEGTFKWNIII